MRQKKGNGNGDRACNLVYSSPLIHPLPAGRVMRGNEKWRQRACHMLSIVTLPSTNVEKKGNGNGDRACNLVYVVHPPS